MAEHEFGLILIDLSYAKLRTTEIFLQDTVKKQMLITLIVVKPSGANEHEVSE